MTITFLLPGFPRKPVGGYRIVYEYANRLTERGHTVHLIYPAVLSLGRRPSWRATVLQLLDGVRSFLLRPAVSWMTLDPRVRQHFVWRIRSGAIPTADVVVATWWETAESLRDLPPSRGRGVYFVQGLESWLGSRDSVVRTWHLPVPKIVVSNWLRQTLLEAGVREHEIRHVPNAVDHGTFRVRRPNGTRGPSVAFLGAAEPHKGTGLAIQVVERLKDRVPRLAAIAFGTGRRPEALPEWIRYVRRPSPSILAREVYGNAAVFLYTSDAEGWGLPGAEAMACGCALVSTDNGGVRDYLVDGESGILCSGCGVSELTEAVYRLLSDSRHREALADAGAAHIRRFHWQRSVDLFEQALRDASTVA